MDFNTDRLLIRPVSKHDSESIFFYRSDFETNRYLSLIPNSIDDVTEFIGKTSSEIDMPGTWFQFVVIEKGSDNLIGDIGVHFLDNETKNKQVEIGYTLDKRYRGYGYATESLFRVIDFLITDLNKHRIIASVDPTNLKSIRLLERLGFRKEAHFVESLFFHEKWVDDMIYAMLAKDWLNKWK